MTTAKHEVQEILNLLPDSSTYEEIQYHLYVRQKIEKSLTDIKNGNVVSHEEVIKRMTKWVKP